MLLLVTTGELIALPPLMAVPFELVMFFSIYRCWCDGHVSVRNGSGGDECALRESLTEGKVLAWGLRQLDQQVIRRYAGAFDDLRVQFFQQGQAGLYRAP
jgi:hypothetical protein